jgi:GNAT superfamily N-acetyltransferase
MRGGARKSAALKPTALKPTGRKPVARKLAGLRVRRGTRRDAPIALAMIRGLAGYEKLAHEVRATSAGLRRDGYGKRRFFRVLLAERGGRAVGFALYFFAYSTFVARPTLYLEDLFVLPAERGTGAGMALMRALAQEALKEGCKRMDWLVLDWNTPAIAFYKSLGAELHPGWIPTRLSGAPLERLARRTAATGRARR